MLDTTKKYWTVKDVAGTILLAIEAESGETSCTGYVNECQESIDPAEDLFTFTNASGVSVASVSSTGSFSLLGSILPQWLSNSDDEMLVETDFPPTSSNYVITQAQKNATPNINDHIMVPYPLARGRIYENRRSQYDYELNDVSYKAWRRRWVPGGYPEDYDLRLGFYYKYRSPWNSPNSNESLKYSMANLSSIPDIPEYPWKPKVNDDVIGDAANEGDYIIRHTGQNEWVFQSEITGGAGNDRSHSSSDWPKGVFESTGKKKFSMTFTDDGYLKSGEQMDDPGNSEDSLGTAPPTRLWLYDMNFPKVVIYRQPFSDNTIRGTQADVIAGVRPAGMPHVTTTKLIFYSNTDGAYDKNVTANVGHDKFEFRSPGGWDGLLYSTATPPANPAAKYVTDTDIRMKAEVTLEKLTDDGYEPHWDDSKPTYTETIEAPVYMFRKDPAAQYGFDAYCGSTIDAPFVKPWISLPAGANQSQPVQFQFFYDTNSVRGYYQFQMIPCRNGIMPLGDDVSVSLSSPFYAANGATTFFNVIGNTTSKREATIKVKTVGDSEGWPIYGKDLGVVVYPQRIKTCKVVLVEDPRYAATKPTGSVLDIQSLKESLDSIFKPANVTCNIDQTIDTYEYEYDDSPQNGNLATDPPFSEIGGLTTSLYWDYSSFDVVICLVNKLEDCQGISVSLCTVLGIGNRVLFVATNREDGRAVLERNYFNKVVSHEVGHVIGNLDDIFAGNPNNTPVNGCYTADDVNLMSYAAVYSTKPMETTLRKFQWDTLNRGY